MSFFCPAAVSGLLVGTRLTAVRLFGIAFLVTATIATRRLIILSPSWLSGLIDHT